MNRLSATTYFLAILIVWLPLQSFVAALAGGPLGLSPHAAFLLAHWYEPLVLVLLAYQAIRKVVGKEKPSSGEALCMTFLACVAAAALISPFSHSFTLQGVRYLSLMAGLFLLASWLRPDERSRLFLTRTYLAIALAVAAWALLERLFPPHYWNAWMASFPASWGFGNFLVGQTQRSVSFLGGPNQLAAFLLPAIFLLVPQAKKRISPVLLLAGEALLIAACLAALSRASWMGLAVASPYLVWRLWPFARSRVAAVTAYLAVLGLLFIAYEFHGHLASDLLTHGSSQAEHYRSLTQATAEVGRRFAHDMGRFLLGGGPGTAGPLTQYYGIAMMPESWYFQLLLESGLLSLVAWLGFVGALFRGLWRNGQLGLCFGLVAVSVTALFLHTFADDPGVAALFILAAVALPRSGKAGIVGI